MAHPGAVLVDTNIILECHDRRCWGALTGAYQIETVEPCIIETQTGYQRRRSAIQIDEQTLRRSLAAVHQVTNEQIAEVLLKGGAALDPGERALWAHALSRTDETWILCGPDRASMRFGYEVGMRARLVSLGGLFDDIRYRRPTPLRPHFEKLWLDNVLSKLVLGIL